MAFARFIEVVIRSWVAVILPDHEERGFHIKPDDVKGEEDPLARIEINYRGIVADFLGTEADILVLIEDDMVVPQDAVLRLTKALGHADVAYGLYAFRHNLPDPDWNAHLEIDRPGYSLRRFPEAARASWGKVIPVKGIGFGCTAIKREVLERVKIERRGAEGCDYYFALDVDGMGFKQVCDLGLICGHYLVYQEQPITVWPALNEHMCRIETAI